MVQSEEQDDEKNLVMSQKMDIRGLFRLSKCGKHNDGSNGLHIWIKKGVIDSYSLEAGDHVVLQIKEVQYANLRDIKKA